MKKITLLLSALCAGNLVWAAPRSQADAQRIARSFLSKKATPALLRSVVTPQLAATSQTLLKSEGRQASPVEQPAFYIYNQDTQAFVIVSGDDRMPEVLAYSTESAFITENLPDNVRNWLGYYADVYALVNQEKAGGKPKRFSLPKEQEFPSSVSPLLGDIQYNQDAPYNLKCPLYNGNRSVTGCVATAAAQIMRYWQYPDVGTGSVSYTTGSLGLSVSYNYAANPFNWNNILPTYTGNESTTEKNAVANLMLACGAAAQMDYTPSMSGAYDDNLFTGLAEHLGYTADFIAKKYYYTPEEWMDLIKTELSAQRPLYYSGQSTQGGHAFVVDGYDAQDMVHVNWGWGGYCNGYFDVLALNSDGSGIGGFNDGSYQFGQMMFVGLQPAANNASTSTQFSISSMTVNKSEVTRSGYFSVECTQSYNNGLAVDGQLGLIFEQDGTQTPLRTFSISVDHNWGWNSYTFNDVHIPSNAKVGSGLLYVGSKKNGETRWERARGPLTSTTAYHVTVETNRCVFTSTAFDISQLTCDMTFTHSIFQGHETGIVLNLHNNAEERFAGEIGLVFYNMETEEMSEYLQGRSVILDPDESIEIAIPKATSCAPGTYACFPVVNAYFELGLIGEEEEVTIKKPESGTPILRVSNVTLPTKTVNSGNALTIQASLSTSGKGSVSETFLYHRYYRPGESEARAYVWDKPYVEKGTTVDYSYDFTIDAEPGTYVYELYKYTNDTFTKVYQSSFTVTEAGNSIREAESSSTGRPFIRQRGADGTLLLHCPAGISEISICNAAGQQVRSLVPVSLSQDDYRVNTGTLPAGIYVLRIAAGDHNVHSLKFIR